MSSCLLRLALFVACVLSIRCTAAPGTEAEAHTASRDTCASCGVAQPEDPESGRLNVDFLEAVKRHILSRLQMRERPNITHPVSKAAMVTALRKLHAGKLREDGRVEIPNLDGHPMSNDVLEESSEIISFAEKGDARAECPSRSDVCLSLTFLEQTTQSEIQPLVPASLSVDRCC